MEYLHVLSRPKVIDQEHDVIWTEAYVDSTVSLHEATFELYMLFTYKAPRRVWCRTDTAFNVTQNALNFHPFECGLCMYCYDRAQFS